jgi:hypothetical protein
MPQWVEWHAHGAFALAPRIAMFGDAGLVDVAPPQVQNPPPAIARSGAMIEIGRGNRLTGSARNVESLVDGDNVGEVANGKLLVFRAAPRQCEIAARFDYIKSAPFAVDAQPGRARVVELGLPSIADVGAQLSGLLGHSKYFRWNLLD